MPMGVFKAWIINDRNLQHGEQNLFTKLHHLLTKSYQIFLHLHMSFVTCRKLFTEASGEQRLSDTYRYL